jgi:integrase
MQSKRHHLKQSPSGSWLVQIAVPSDLLPVFGRKIITKSLETRDLRVACDRRDVALGEARRLFEAHRRKGSIDSKEGLIQAARSLQDQGKPEAWDGVAWAAWERWGPEPEHYPQEILEGLDRGKHIIEHGEGVLLSAAVDAYLKAVAGRVTPKTLGAKKKRLESFLEAVGDIEARTLDRRICSHYITGTLLPRFAHPKTRSDIVADLRAFTEHLVLTGELDSNPFARLQSLVKGSSRGAAPSRRAWTDEELFRLLSHIRDDHGEDDPLWRLTVVGAYSGMRLNEVCEMQWADVDGAAFHIKEGKNRNSVRAVPIHPRLLPLVDAWRGDGFVIPRLKPGGTDLRRGHGISKKFGRVKTEQGFPSELVFHGLRHSFVSALERAGVAESTAELIVGHRRQGMSFGHYSQGPGFEMLRDAVARVSYGAADRVVTISCTKGA